MARFPGNRLGFYEITAPLGAGGMGEVYRAKDTRLNRAVAVKVLPTADQRVAECPPACAHDICTAGPPLDPACSDCVAQICAGDPACCATSWNACCASEAQRSCAGECP